MVSGLTSVLRFKGRLTFEKIGILLNDFKASKESFNIHPVLYKKLLTLMIEVLENILKYSDQFEEFIEGRPEHQPEFELYHDESRFLLISRNPVLDSTIENITSRIDRVNRSGEEELKNYFRETITNGTFTEKGGAGLGFIEMAKIASHPIAVRFEPVGDGYHIFELKLQINHN